MTRPPIHAPGRVLLLPTLLLLALLLPIAEAAEPKRVVILHSYGRDFAPFNATGSVLRTELASQLHGPVVFLEASLESERAGGPVDERPIVDFLLSRAADKPPDLVVIIGAPALRFYLRSRPRLFPQARVLVTAIDPRMVPAGKLEPTDVVVSVRLDNLGTARDILQLLPDTTLLAIIVGGTQHELLWQKELLRELAPLSGRLRLVPLGGLTLEQLRQRVAALPAGSAVLYFMYARGPDEVPQENERALAAVIEASSAPVFGLYEPQLGSGIVGGQLLRLRRMGEVSAQIARDILVGRWPERSSVQLELRAPIFDWRALERWGIPESRLPPGAEVRFRPPSLWEQHRLLIMAGVAIVVFQAAMITALLVQGRRRRRAETAAVALSGRLLTAQEDERRRLARELHDDLTQRLARLAIDAGRLERSAGAGASAMRQDLVRLSEDVHALSYRLHPSVLDDLGLVEALRAECDRVARHGDLRVDVEARGVPEAVPAETSLCLFRVAQEALSNAARHGSATAVTVLLSPRGQGLQLAVSDNGSGFDPERSRERASLGLASMRERVRLLRGELDIESTPGRGTTVVAWVPA